MEAFRRVAVPLVPAPALLLVQLLVPPLAAVAPAQQLAWHVEPGIRLERIGSAIAVAPDRDGDGIGELLVGVPLDSGSTMTAGVRLLSGADLSLLLEFESPDHFGYRMFGTAVAVVGDLDGDQVADFAISNPQLDVVHLVRGTDGSVIRSITVDPAFYWSFGQVLEAMGDVDGDSVPDLAIATPTTKKVVPRVEIRSGATKKILHFFEGSQQYSGFGASGRFANAGDLDHDGSADLALLDVIDATVDYGRLVVASGATGATLLAVDFTVTAPDSFGFGSGGKVCGAGDVDGDGIPDLAILGGAAGVAVVAVISGADGSELLRYGSMPSPWESSIGSAGDADGDGVPEIAVRMLTIVGGPTSSIAWLFNGRDGTLLATEDLVDHFGQSFLAGHDFDGDAVADFVLGDPEHAVGGVTTGRVEARRWSGGGLIAGRDGETTLLTLSGQPALLGDVDGDGWRDLAAPNGTLYFANDVRILSGHDGAEIAIHPIADDADGGTAPVGDRDGDGVDDYAIALNVGFGGFSKIEVRSTATGSLLASILSPSGANDWGRQLVASAEPDGSVRLGVAAPASDRNRRAGGEFSVVDPADGSTRFTRFGDQAFENLGSAIAALGDVDGDGIGDWALGSPGFDGAVADGGRVQVVSGSGGATLLALLGDVAGGRFGAQVIALGDVDGDWVPDFAASAPQSGTGNSGRITLHSGADGSLLQQLDGAAGDLLGSSLAGLGDLNRDGAGDWVHARSSSGLEVRSGRDASLLAIVPTAELDQPWSGWPVRAATLAGESIDGAPPSDLFVWSGGPSSPGHLSLYELDDLMLQVVPDLAAQGEFVVADLRGGPMARPCAIELVSIDGMHVGLIAALGAFDAFGAFQACGDVPPGLAGLRFELRGWGIGFDGRLVDSPEQPLEFR